MVRILTAWLSGLLAVAILTLAAPATGRTVKVGLYDNPPKVAVRETGQAEGIFIDILEHVARVEGWRLEYVTGTWTDGMERLAMGEIDLLPDVAFTEERKERIAFNAIPVFMSWIQVYAPKSEHITSVAALKGKRVAVLRGAVQEGVIREISTALDLDLTVIALPDYTTTAAYVHEGRADVLIACRFFGYLTATRDTLTATPVILYPRTLHYATRAGANEDLLSAIDTHLTEMLNDPDSTYYNALSRWLGEKPQRFLPGFFSWLIAGFTGLALLLGALSILFRRQVRKRTRELRRANAELAAALDDLAAAQQEAVLRERLCALGEAAGGVAHDFNNLLVPILTSSELLLADDTQPGRTDETTKLLESIRAAARHGAKLIRRMQRFYRATREREDRETLDLNDIVRETIALLEPRWAERENEGLPPVTLQLELAPEARVNGWRSDLHALLLNLLVNATDALVEGGRIRLATARHSRNIVLTVQDEGCGMSEETRQRCMHPFYTTKGEGGTGLGLAMVKTITAEHSGKITIASEEGVGTCFTVELPASPSSHEEEEP